jgi:hypothetical protein
LIRHAYSKWGTATDQSEISELTTTQWVVMSDASAFHPPPEKECGISPTSLYLLLFVSFRMVGFDGAPELSAAFVASELPAVLLRHPFDDAATRIVRKFQNCSNPTIAIVQSFVLPQAIAFREKSLSEGACTVRSTILSCK